MVRLATPQLRLLDHSGLLSGNMAPNNHRPSLRLQPAQTLRQSFYLLPPRELMKERAGVNEVELSVLQAVSAICEDVSGDELRVLQRVSVFEELVAQIDEGLIELGAGQIARRGPFKGQLPDVLTETAAYIEQGGAVFQSGEDVIVVQSPTDGEFEEGVAADAGKFDLGPTFVSL